MARIIPFPVVIACGIIAAVSISCSGKKSVDPRESERRFTYIPGDKSGVKFSNILSSSEYFNIRQHPGFFDGGNVAVGDINKDGLSDLYFVSNQWDNKLYLNKGDFRFEDITTRAGVTGAGNWKTAAVMKDADGDGDIDIYVRGVKGNRYINTDDQLFLNNGDLTFSRSFELFGLDSLKLDQGTAVADINNDGLKDVITVGAFPFEEQLIGSTPTQSPNTMQVNQGNNLYIDIAWYAGVAATDKSWMPLIADFDNDGLDDLFITNGVFGRIDPKDTSKVEDLPTGAVPNFIFKQTDELKFTDMTAQWIGKTPGLSNGAALADLDNDGDMDIVVNNINSEAFIMRNDVSGEGEKKETKASYHTADPLLQRVNLFPFRHNENAFNTLEKQPGIPFSNATRGPKMAIADINGDKIDDVYVSGGQQQPGSIFIQTKAGKFVQLPQPAFEADRNCEETCATFFDVDGDRDMDLLVGSGGEEFLDKRLLLRLYINNGRGTFSKAEGLKRADIVSSLQKIYVNASCLVPADVDNDGDMDVFVGGGTVTGRYGVDSDSFILLNDGKGMLIESPSSFENRQRPGGMVQAAAWFDFDGDKYPELITAGDWMTVSIWKNDSSTLKRVSGNGLDSTYGLWNSLAVEDLDSDGDVDIIAGNFGLNNRMHPPLELSRKMPQRRITTLETTLFRNEGGNKFTSVPLPGPAQYFPVFGINVTDVDNDGKKDIMLVGNLKAAQADLGNFNAGYGLVLSGVVNAMPLQQSGFVVKGEGRDIKTILNFKKEKFYLITVNNDSLISFKNK